MYSHKQVYCTYVEKEVAVNVAVNSKKPLIK